PGCARASAGTRSGPCSASRTPSRTTFGASTTRGRRDTRRARSRARSRACTRRSTGRSACSSPPRRPTRRWRSSPTTEAAARATASCISTGGWRRAASSRSARRRGAGCAPWREEAGRPVVGGVWRREELYAGPFVERAPDLVLELALVDGYSRSCLPSAGPGPALRRLAPAEHGGGKGRGMNGAHRPDGLFVLAGAGVRPAGALGPADIVDVLPTLLALAGEPVPGGLDGR